jgi:hypothetical protein
VELHSHIGCGDDGDVWVKSGHFIQWWSQKFDQRPGIQLWASSEAMIVGCGMFKIWLFLAWVVSSFIGIIEGFMAFLAFYLCGWLDRSVHQPVCLSGRDRACTLRWW